MSTTWALTAEQIVDQACWNLGLAQVGRSVRAEHRTLGLRLLNGVIKSMPAKGFLWPKTTESEWPFVISPGSMGAITGPTDFASSPLIRLFRDRIKAGFDKANSTTTVGDLDLGGSFDVTTGTWGISNGYAYQTIALAQGGMTKDTGVSDGEVGITFSTNTNGDYPTLLFRAPDANNFLAIINFNGSYQLWQGVAGVQTAIRTYATAPAAGDRVAVRFIGPTIVFILNGVEQIAHQTTVHMDETSVGFGGNGITARYKNFYFSSGDEWMPDIITAGKWNEIPNKQTLADEPTAIYLDATNQLRPWPVANYFIRGTMQYQAKLDDLSVNTAPDLPADMHLTLVHMLTEELSIPTGRRKQAAESAQKWRESLPEQIAFHSDQGDIFFDYDE